MPQACDCHQNDTFALVALGANLAVGGGDPADGLTAALRRIANETVQFQAVSRYYRTPAVPAGSGPDYVNAVASLRARGPAEALLQHLHAIEMALGRHRIARWEPRVIDLDLLAFGTGIVPDSETQTAWAGLDAAAQAREAPDRLILPHPRLQDRAFVLVPLADVAPRWRHPVTGRSVAEMLAALPAAERAGIRPIGPAGPTAG